MKFWIVFGFLVFAAVVTCHEHDKNAGGDEHDDEDCDKQCLNGGQCIGKGDSQSCKCYNLNVTTSTTTYTEMSFSGELCQDNFFMCFFDAAKREVLVDASELYRRFEAGILHHKYRSSCGLLNEVIDGLEKSLDSCSHLSDNDVVEGYYEKFQVWKKSQSKYCKVAKYAYGDDCCGRNCKKFDKERLCQCNNACRRYGDCCYRKTKLCKWRQANQKDFFAATPARWCKKVDGKPCQKVQIKSNQTMIGIIDLFTELQFLNEKIVATVKNVSVAGREHRFVLIHKPHHHQLAEQVRRIKAAFVRDFEEKSYTDTILEDCGNCSRKDCENPCPPTKCKCEEYPEAICKKDVCVLSPCDSSGKCVARWYKPMNTPTEDEEAEYIEVTLKCLDTPHDCS